MLLLTPDTLDGGVEEDIDMEAATPTAHSSSAFLTGGFPAEAETMKRDNSEISLSTSKLSPFVLAGSDFFHNRSSTSALSALAQLAAIAQPIEPDDASEEPEWAYGGEARGVDDVSGNVIIIDGRDLGEEQRAIKIPSFSNDQDIGTPYLCSPFLLHCSPHSTIHNQPMSKPYTHTILGNSSAGAVTNPSSGTTTAPRNPEQGSREQGNFDIDTDDNRERTKEVASISPLVFGSNLIHPPPPLSISLSQPSLSRRSAPIPEALSARSIRPSPPSLSQGSPRHSPYSHPSARLFSNSADALRSARVRLNNAATMSPSSTSTSATPTPLGTGAIPPTTPPGHSTGFHTPLASPSSSMSMSKRRRAPEWPSPRTHHSRSYSSSHHAPPPASAFSRDLAQTIRTPAILRVPPTPDYSPAFYRSGFATHPESASSGTMPIPPYTQEVPTQNSNSEPLGRRASAFGSAPSLDTPRLPDPPVTPGPMTGNPTSASAKRQRVNLMGIPKGWVIEQLNRRAGQYWHNPATSDIRILVPVPRSRLPKRVPASTPLTQDSAQSFHSNQPGHTVWPVTPVLAGLVGATEGHNGLLNNVKAGHTSEESAGGRRGSLPGTDDVVALVFPLHQDYLITQSSLFQSLFAPAPPSHLDAPAAPRSIKGARRLPTPPGAPPAVLLPLPDPASFSVLVHWLYWGDITALESALSRGLVEWQGVVKNVHYLGMDDNVKRVLGKWWRKWVKTDEGRARSMGSKMKGKEAWADSDDEEEDGEGRDEELDESESGHGRGDVMEMEGHHGLRHTQSTRDVDDGGVSGLLRAL